VDSHHQSKAGNKDGKQEANAEFNELNFVGWQQLLISQKLVVGTNRICPCAGPDFTLRRCRNVQCLAKILGRTRVEKVFRF
jgi:hypothetical protein